MTVTTSDVPSLTRAWAARIKEIAETKEAVCEAAKKWDESRELFYGYADMHTSEVAKTLENAFDNAQDALIAAVDALIKAEAIPRAVDLEGE